jgi:Ion channel/Pentapeptide repeats (8 copies)
MANPEHLAKLMEGVEAWNKWREENPSIIPDLASAHLEEAFLDGAHLEGANLRLADLKGTDLNDAHLQGANLLEAHLEGAHLMGAHLEGACLFRAYLEQGSLSEAHLEGADLRFANLTDANVTALSYLGPRLPVQERNPSPPSGKGTRFWRWLSNNPVRYRKRVMRGRYQGIRGISSCYGNRIFVRDAADQDYLDTLESQLAGRRGRFGFWLWGLIDYGRSFMSIVLIAGFFISLFGFAYSHCPHIVSAGSRCPTPFTPYYFSIVTYTTLGFGDVKPNNLAGEILVSLEVIMGYVTLGLLLAVLGDKIARRS